MAEIIGCHSAATCGKACDAFDLTSLPVQQVNVKLFNRAKGTGKPTAIAATRLGDRL
jgi:hypothetical protein